MIVLAKMQTLRTMLLVSAACVFSACSGGGSQVTPAGDTALRPTTVSQVATRGARSEDRGGGDRNNGDRDDNNGTIVYNSIPKPVHAIASQGFECCQVNEFGDGVHLTHTGRLDKVSVVMDSWGCQAGHWYSNDCVTVPGTGFTHPITLNVYSVSHGTTRNAPDWVVGPLLATRTQTFTIPYRPSADHVRCTGNSANDPTNPGNAGKFYSTVDHACVNGLANVITFDFSHAGVTLPAQAVFSVAYNTSDSGYHPLGTALACSLTPGGCGYDSLNVGADGNGGPVGSVVDPNGVFIDYSNVAKYCDPSQGPGFRLDTSTNPNCSWAGFHPQIRVTVGGGGGSDDHRDRDRDHEHGD